MKRWFLFIVAGLLLGAAIGYFYFAPSLVVEVTVARRGPIREFIEERAKTRLPRIYRITMPIAGRVQTIDLIEGDSVSQGQQVAQLDAFELETAVAEATARVQRLDKMIVENADTRLEMSAIDGLDKVMESLDSAVESAEAQLEASRAKLEFATKEFKRRIQLFERKAVSESELNEAELLEIESRVQYQQDLLTLAAIRSIRSATAIGRTTINQYIDKKDLRQAVLEQEKSEAEADQSRSQYDLGLAKIVSPVNGTVLEKAISNERVLSAGELLLEIGQLDDLEVESEILSEDVVRVDIGDPVDIEGAAIGPTPIGGHVSRIYPQGFTKVSSLGVEQQRVMVVIQLAPEDLSALRASGRNLGVDYRVRVRIFTASAPNAVKLPRAALFRSALGKWQAFRVRDGRAQLVDLKVGLANDVEVQVVSGIEEGDLVVLAPDSNLEPGMRVTARRLPSE